MHHRMEHSIVTRSIAGGFSPTVERPWSTGGCITRWMFVFWRRTLESRTKRCGVIAFPFFSRDGNTWNGFRARITQGITDFYNAKTIESPEFINFEEFSEIFRKYINWKFRRRIMQPKASVLIPVKNGGALLAEVLDAVLAQEAPWPFEVLIVDSGSSDDSVALAQGRGVRTWSIAPAEFGHGRTRNYLASLSHGDFLVFITNAKPADAHWLRHLVQVATARPMWPARLARTAPTPAPGWSRSASWRSISPALAANSRACAWRMPIVSSARRAIASGCIFFEQQFLPAPHGVGEAAVPGCDVRRGSDLDAGRHQGRPCQGLRARGGGVPLHDFGVWETLQRNFDEASSFQRDFGYQVQPSLARALASSVLRRRDALDAPGGRPRRFVAETLCLHGRHRVGAHPGAVSGHPAPAAAGLAAGRDLARPVSAEAAVRSGFGFDIHRMPRLSDMVAIFRRVQLVRFF